MNCSYSGISCQLQKSSKKRPSPSRLATLARGLGDARLRSIPRSTSATCSGSNTPRSTIAPSRWNASIDVAADHGRTLLTVGFRACAPWWSTRKAVRRRSATRSWTRSPRASRRGSPGAVSARRRGGRAAPQGRALARRPARDLAAGRRLAAVPRAALADGGRRTGRAFRRGACPACRGRRAPGPTDPAAPPGEPGRSSVPAVHVRHRGRPEGRSASEVIRGGEPSPVRALDGRAGGRPRLVHGRDRLVEVASQRLDGGRAVRRRGGAAPRPLRRRSAAGADRRAAPGRALHVADRVPALRLGRGFGEPAAGGPRGGGRR